MAARQFPDNDFRLVVKTDGQPTSLVPAVRSVIEDVAPECAVFNPGTMADWLSETMAGPRFTTLLLTGFALIALILSATGLYGVMAYMVALRTREVGIRVALGASPLQVIRRFLWLGLKTAGLGLVLGLMAAPAATGVLRSVLYATEIIDLPTYVMVSMVLLVVVLAATVVPALRALRVDPSHALRAE
jgi:ABC-type antimicrobial peptide transport system permease subunit